MALIEKVKLKPIAADISSLALNRLFHQIDQDDEAPNHLMVQVDLQTVNVCIFENNLPVFMRHLNMDIKRDNWNHSLTSDSYSRLIITGKNQRFSTL